MNTRLIASFVLLALVVVFAIQNATTVEIRLLFWQVSLPRSLLIFMMLLIGIIVGWFGRSAFRVARNRKEPE